MAIRCKDPDCFFKHGYHCHACLEGFETMSQVSRHTAAECTKTPVIKTMH